MWGKLGRRPMTTSMQAPHDGQALGHGAGRSVLVTGASSFLGASLVGLFEEDPRVGRIVAVDVRRPSFAGAKTRYYETDFTHPSAEARLGEVLAAERVDTVVHLAFHGAPSKAAELAHELESVGTRHLFLAARAQHVRKVVLWSQTWGYGAAPDNPAFLDERRPLRARRDEPFFSDKIDAEDEAARLAARGEAEVTVLRTAPIVGPNIDNVVTRYLARRLVPTWLGFDPMIQVLHELDAVAALRLSVFRPCPGVFNVVGDGVLRLSTAIRLAGRTAVPLPGPVLGGATSALWLAQLAPAPPTLLPYLRYPCVADGRRARAELGFRPLYTTREAVVDFAGARRLRDVKLLAEAVE